MVQWDNQKLVSKMSRVRLQAVIVFINNLINDKSKHKKQILLFVLYCSGPLTVIYYIYKSMTY